MRGKFNAGTLARRQVAWRDRYQSYDKRRWLANRQFSAPTSWVREDALRFALRPVSLSDFLMAFARSLSHFLCVFLVLSSAAISALHAAPITINGAAFDAPAACVAADGALVCKEDGQQLEVSVTRKPLSASVGAAGSTDSLVRRMADFNQLHESAVANIMRSTGNDKATPFSAYGRYVAVGSAIAGKGVVSSPTAHFASVLHGNEIWQFLEVVAVRTPAVEALSAALQRSLVLPALPAAPKVEIAKATIPETPPKFEGSPLVATFSGKLLSLQYPGYLNPVVIEDTAERLQVNFKHKTRAIAGPDLLVSLRAPQDKQTAAALVKLRKEAVTASMAGKTDSVELNKLGEINGAGFALIGRPDKAKGLSGVESFETTFAADVGGRILEVRLTAEQQYASEARVVWSAVGNSITFAK
jgi:hypothetical protein